MPPDDLVACEVARPVMSGRHFYPVRPERFFVRNHYG